MLWKKAIILVDMNAFFASVEQLDYPELYGQPVAVTNGYQGTCIITCSYEARAYGIKTGMRIYEAKNLCPHLIQRSSRPHRYAEVSTNIMEAMQNITPDLEIFSVDEAFLDVTNCQRLHGEPVVIGKMVKQKVLDVANILCSIGISGDKTTAKYAAKQKKPNGFTVIPPWEAKEKLRDVKVTELCGIAEGIGNFLAQYGVYTCKDIEKIHINVLAKRFGNLGRRIWLMCQGLDPEPIIKEVAPPKSMGHGKVMPPKTFDKNIILMYLLHMSTKLASRLRHHEMEAQKFFVGLSITNGWLSEKYKLVIPTDDSRDIYRMCKEFVEENWRNDPVWQVQVTALDPMPKSYQLDLFAKNDKQRFILNKTVDTINDKFGNYSIAPAAMLNRSTMPNVISPSWKAKGYRNTINN